MALDAASTAFLAQLAEQGVKPFHQMGLDNARAFMASLRDIIGPGPEMLRIEESMLGEGEQRFRVRVLIPNEEPRGIILYCHGGGWVLMSIDEYDSLGRFLAKETGCCVILVDYRLAPEHPYPAAVDDAWLALTWADTQRQHLSGSSHTPLLVAGDSAGGNLAAVVAQRTTRSGAPALAQQVLIYPVTQPNLTTPGYLDPDNQGLLGQADMAWFWNYYLQDADRRNDVDASPLLAHDVAGGPPTVLITAEHDVLRDEGELYAHRLSSAGITVQYKCFAGQMHGFFTMFDILPASHDARNFVVQAILQRLQVLESGSIQLPCS